MTLPCDVAGQNTLEAWHSAFATVNIIPTSLTWRDGGHAHVAFVCKGATWLLVQEPGAKWSAYHSNQPLRAQAKPATAYASLFFGSYDTARQALHWLID
jgi:hypothetical protein